MLGKFCLIKHVLQSRFSSHAFRNSSITVPLVLISWWCHLILGQFLSFAQFFIYDCMFLIEVSSSSEILSSPSTLHCETSVFKICSVVFFKYFNLVLFHSL